MFVTIVWTTLHFIEDGGFPGGYFQKNWVGCAGRLHRALVVKRYAWWLCEENFRVWIHLWISLAGAISTRYLYGSRSSSGEKSEQDIAMSLSCVYDTENATEFSHLSFPIYLCRKPWPCLLLWSYSWTALRRPLTKWSSLIKRPITKIPRLLSVIYRK